MPERMSLLIFVWVIFIIVVDSTYGCITIEEADKQLSEYEVFIESPHFLIINVGENTTYLYKIVNSGLLNDTYYINISSIQNWANFSDLPSTLFLQAETNETFTIHISIPSNVSSESEEYITILVTSQSNPLILDERSIEITINDSPENILQEDIKVIPGFELFIVICAIGLFLFWNRKRHIIL